MIVPASETIAYGRAIAHATGVTIRFETDDGCPRCTQDDDGNNVVILQNKDCTGELEFEARCGVANHEIAHAKFQTVPNCGPWAKKIADKFNMPWAEFAAHKIINACVDIADETRLIRQMPSTAKAMRTNKLLCSSVWREKWKAGEAQEMPEWFIGSIVMIIWTRLSNDVHGGGRAWLYTYKAGSSGPHFNDFDLRRMGAHFHGWGNHRGTRDAWREVWQIAMKLRENGKPTKNWARNKSAWNRMYLKCEKVFELLRHLIKPEDEAACAAAIEAISGDPAKDGSTGDPMQAAAEVGIEQAHEKGIEENKLTGGPPGHQRHAGYDNAGDVEFYKRAKHKFAQAVEVLMESADSMKLNRLDVVGDDLTDDYTHIFTDGNVFTNPEKCEAQELNLALLLDKSGSMQGSFPKASATCRALGEVVQDAGGDVECWMFGTSCVQRPVSRVMDSIALDGGTSGHQAFTQATDWLNAKYTGRKMIVVITDGDLSDITQCRQVMRRGYGSGIEYVLMGLGVDPQYLWDKWTRGVRAIGSSQCDLNELVELLIRTVGPAVVGA